jgi:uncharacterized membrane protein
MNKRVGKPKSRKQPAINPPEHFLIFWRNLLLYFLFFSYIGHYIEMAWCTTVALISGSDLPYNILSNPLEPYTIYGAGVILCILLVQPIAKRFNNNIFATFLSGTLILAALEYFSSVILTLRHGHNPYWNYSNTPFNLGGHITLVNSLLFGLLATIFLHFIYPITERTLRKTNQTIINIFLLILLVLFASYYLNLV